MFKAIKVEKKRNKLTYRSTNKSLFVQKFRPLFISIPRAIVTRTYQELKMHSAKFLEYKQIITAEKMQQKSYRVYPSEIIQTSSLGRLQKKSFEHNGCLYLASVSERSVRKPPTDNCPSLQNCFQANCRSVIPMHL